MEPTRTPSSLAPGPPPAIPPLLAPLCPLGSNRSSHGQNTISFNKLNLLRLLITSGVGSDQRQREEAAAPGVLVVVVGGNPGTTHGGRQIAPGPGDRSHSDRRSGQVSILLDKNRKEGVYPPLPLAHEGDPLSPRKNREAITLR